MLFSHSSACLKEILFRTAEIKTKHLVNHCDLVVFFPRPDGTKLFPSFMRLAAQEKSHSQQLEFLLVQDGTDGIIVTGTRIIFPLDKKVDSERVVPLDGRHSRNELKEATTIHFLEMKLSYMAGSWKYSCPLALITWHLKLKHRSFYLTINMEWVQIFRAKSSHNKLCVADSRWEEQFINHLQRLFLPTHLIWREPGQLAFYSLQNTRALFQRRGRAAFQWGWVGRGGVCPTMAVWLIHPSDSDQFRNKIDSLSTKR